jgi:superfamily I DNA and/or RNA helicase
MQERLMTLDIYHSGLFATSQHLRGNYRSHESILAVSSSLFYDSKLRSLAEDAKKNRSLNWEGLEGRDFPLLFYDSSDGEHMSQVDNPSFFNKHETTICVQFVQKLIRSENLQIQYDDIAIITPFRAQVLRLRKELRKIGAYGVGVGQIEDYQGQEKAIVIISTVLTEAETRWQGEDGQNSLGFLRDPKKFNVAISRAEGLCIFIGKVDFLLESEDNYFAALITHCKANESISGDASSNHVTTGLGSKGGSSDFDYKGLDALLHYIEETGLGKGSEFDKMENAMRGYSSCEGDRWRITL